MGTQPVNTRREMTWYELLEADIDDEKLNG
jgi:hypothetical protein